MVKTYRFVIEGTGAGGQTWKTSGEFDSEFHESIDDAMARSFDQLTSGNAIYGMPGLGCSGPYDVRRVLIEQVLSN